jgi:hypothetical protein
MQIGEPDASRGSALGLLGLGGPIELEGVIASFPNASREGSWMTWRRTRRHPDRPVRVLFGVGGSLIGQRGGLRIPGRSRWEDLPALPEHH